MEGTRPITLRMMPGDKERIDRTKRTLERNIAKLERQLAHRRSKEGQEATRATILSLRARVHRLNDYLRYAQPSKVQRVMKPIPSSHVQRHVPPKGSQLHKKRMSDARKKLKQDTAPPPPPTEIKADIKQVPPVVDERSAQKAVEVAEANKKAVHEAQTAKAAAERKAQVSNEPAVQEVPKPPTLTPLEKRDLLELPKQLGLLQTRLSAVNKVVNRLNQDGFLRNILNALNKHGSRLHPTLRKRLENEFSKRGVSLREAKLLTQTTQKTTLSRNNRKYVAQKLTHPDLTNIPQKMKSIYNRLNFLKAKQAGLTERARPEERPAPPKKDDSLPMATLNLLKELDAEAQMLPKDDEEIQGWLAEIKSIIIKNRLTNMREAFKRPDLNKLAMLIGQKMQSKPRRQQLGSISDPRPYAMSRGLGMLTIHKQRHMQRLHRPKIESNNMNGLRRYTNAQYAREQRERAAQEADKQVANLAGAFSHTRAVMERLVR